MDTHGDEATRRVNTKLFCGHLALLALALAAACDVPAFPAVSDTPNPDTTLIVVAPIPEGFETYLSMGGEFTIAIPADWDVDKDSEKSADPWSWLVEITNPGRARVLLSITTQDATEPTVEDITAMRLREYRNVPPVGFGRFQRTSSNLINHPSGLPVVKIEGTLSGRSHCYSWLHELVVFAHPREYVVSAYYCVDDSFAYDNTVNAILDSFRPIPR